VTRRGERYHALMAGIVRRLPFGLSRIVAPSFLGFAVINGFTFSVDLGLLSLGHGVLKWPYPAAVTLSYLTAFALSFVLNRAFNFRSHEALGPQTTKYVVALVINYAAFVLGVGDGLTAIGVEYQLARILSGLCEGVYMYSVMRWVVFRDAPRGLDLAARWLWPTGREARSRAAGSPSPWTSQPPHRLLTPPQSAARGIPTPESGIGGRTATLTICRGFSRSG
jgi:putative flippase GtrA